MEVEILIFLVEQGYFDTHKGQVREFLESKGYFDCSKCNKKGITGTGNEDYYMVNDKLWEQHNDNNRLLCWNCLEELMGRKLIATDFTYFPVNNKNARVQELK